MNSIDTGQKLGQITLITPPDFFQSENISYCLINLSKRNKNSFADQLNHYMPRQDITVYLWDDNNFSVADSVEKEDPAYQDQMRNWQQTQLNRDYNWLLNACKVASTVILNMDYISKPLMVWSGYILTLSKTYFINGNEKEARALEVLNRNRVESVPNLFERLYKNKESQ
jgi:hypothetical protein